MTGYQEIATDPSYTGQIVALTTVQVGNYGVAVEDSQTPKSDRARLAGLVVRDLSTLSSSWRASGDLDRWLVRQGVVAITELDTRALTRHIREKGAMRGGIFRQAHDKDRDALIAKVRQTPEMTGQDLASEVSVAEPYGVPAKGKAKFSVALVDLGVKRGILRGLTERGVNVTVYPAATSVEDLLAGNPDGVMLSNGPGDPAAVLPAIETARAVLGTRPVLGICLGYQILALALGGRTFKMRFGHHGGNHPVSDLATGEVWITAQNHGFAVDPDSLPPEVEQTHFSLYDKTLEGIRWADRQLLAVQFHPEGGPGPSDADAIFDRYLDLLRATRAE